MRFFSMSSNCISYTKREVDDFYSQVCFLEHGKKSVRILNYIVQPFDWQGFFPGLNLIMAHEKARQHMAWWNLLEMNRLFNRALTAQKYFLSPR